MDPVSIVGAVGPALQALYSVTTKLYTFITSASKVDKSLEDLQREVRGLTRVLEDIETFQDLIVAQTKNATRGVDSAWAPIYNAIQDTRHTIEALQKVLDRLGSPSDVTNGIKKIVKQAQLNINLEEINSIRSRVQWHSTSLRMCNLKLFPGPFLGRISEQSVFCALSSVLTLFSNPPKNHQGKTILTLRLFQNWHFKQLLCESHRPRLLQTVLSR